MLLRLKKITDADVPPPTYATDGAVGLDLRAVFDDGIDGTNFYLERNESLTLFRWSSISVSTGYAIEIPQGYEGQVRGRSGWTERGLWVAHGTIDQDYRGVVRVRLLHLGGRDIKICNGDRIAQLVVAPVARCDVHVVDKLGETTRGAAGFGSTGVR